MTHLDGSSGNSHASPNDEQNDTHQRETQGAEIIHGPDATMVMQGVKMVDNTPKDDTNPVLESTRSPTPLSTSIDQHSDVASVHSMPAVHITEPSPPAANRPFTQPSAETPRRPPPPSPSRSQTLQEEGSFSQQQRRARHRSVEVRPSNRLSGFFSSLIHRRDHITTGSPRETIHEDPPSPSTPQQTSQTPSRSSSPPPQRSITPPPPLPPPTLRELGLCLSILTSELSPSHFSTPPSSGAFLAPHYLLLCHAQGLDVLPLVSPPALQPYALVRRVSFKSVVVMEQRGVLVAIAGRRDGVRVYALEEVKKAIEWRIEVEVRRERERARRDNVKKIAMRSLDGTNARDSTEKTRKASLSTPPPGETIIRGSLLRKSSYGAAPLPPSPPPVPMIPRSATPRTPRKPRTPSLQIPSTPLSEPFGQPPPYASPIESSQPPDLRSQPSAISINARQRGGSVGAMLTAPSVPRRSTEAARNRDPDLKADWVESSDDEAIDIVAAGSSGSQALDERTSTTLSATVASPPVQSVVVPPAPSLPRPSINARRSRPSHLDLSLVRSNTSVPPPEPSPAPTLLTLRQALSHSPPSTRDTRTVAEEIPDPDTPYLDADDDDDDVDGRISLAQALMESRIPDLPPLGTRQPQQPILISASHVAAASEDDHSSPRTSDGHGSLGRQSNAEQPARRRRRWSVMIGTSNSDVSHEPSIPATPSTAPLARERPSTRFTRSNSFRSNHSQNSSTVRTVPTTETPSGNSSTLVPSQSETTPLLSSQSSRSSRFIPRIISNALQARRSDDRPPLPTQSPVDVDHPKRQNGNQVTPQSPPPKLEYVKLPGTKGALIVKAVETAKKRFVQHIILTFPTSTDLPYPSFLAILCGENGEKVELFAGTYRTALGLSRTFILPDSPRSLELQLQGDDLVEVFLVFSQNVFGLEPATVRVREVRIGRAERRAARRRARENRTGDTPTNDGDAAEEDTNVNVSIGVSVAVGSSATSNGGLNDGTRTPPLVPSEHPGAQADQPPSPTEPTASIGSSQSDDLVTVATAQMGPYTTFQQLSFAPNFPLASIADEYIIPPTYPEFLGYRARHEPQSDGNGTELSQTQFCPPGLPVPTPTLPSRWYYRDPKRVVHGPWKASLMQAWYKDGLLPPDLPVRREEETEFMLLKDLRLQSVDPTQPFRSPALISTPAFSVEVQESEKPLLPPISLLSQPRHFGPPALFFSSRGGHSTAIVDVRGRSVLKGRFIWSNDEPGEDSKPSSVNKMGDVKRLEAFDVKNRSVLVAMRQGGLEAVDLGDALLKPADESRTALPQFHPPPNIINRRAPFVWKIGSPITSPSTAMESNPSKYKASANKKPSIGSTKVPAGRTDTLNGDSDVDIQDEVLFLGRKDDEIYICERNAGSFRILRLSPDPLVTF
ncbi:hypothetical protein BDQ12DRAFT_733353 [Crucibulum laeve]|uniref:GYF domain-containing protein n=1 Tax=Crucibulum laeve TaxID=68775 RepID=A0A5C3M829_9AGAR|nr:hypothetical protein BDQ12DRAFT_733353 [Crucibulum laeve]